MRSSCVATGKPATMLSILFTAVACLSSQLFACCSSENIQLTDPLQPTPLPPSAQSAVLPRCASNVQHYPAVGSPSTVYVRCADPGATSVFVWRCPAPLIWSQSVGGCVDNNRGVVSQMTAIPRALPDLVAVMDSGSPDLIVSQQGLPDRLTTGGNLQTLSSSIHIPFGSYGLPESSAAYPSLLQARSCQDFSGHFAVKKCSQCPGLATMTSFDQPSGSFPVSDRNISPQQLSPATSDGIITSFGGDSYVPRLRQPTAPHRIAAVDVGQLGINPCLLPGDESASGSNSVYGSINDRGVDADAWRSQSTSYYRPHPSIASKYVECFPDRRVIVIRRCGRSTVWSQRHQACIAVEGDGGASSFAASIGDSSIVPSHRSALLAVSSFDGIEGATRLFGDGQQQQLSIANPCSGSAAGDGRGDWTSWIRPVLYYPFPGDETRFIQCAGGAGGRAFVRSCPAGLRWNRRAMTCDRSADGSYSIIWRTTGN